MSVKQVRRGVYELDYRDEHRIRVRDTVEAPTMEAAKRMHAEIKLDVSRRKKGLAAEAPNPQALTVDGTCAWWMTTPACNRLADPKKAKSAVRSLVMGRAIGSKRADLVTPADVDAFLDGLDSETRTLKNGDVVKRYGPKSINHARAWLRTVFGRAMKSGKLRLLSNPVLASETREKAQIDLVTLTAQEVVRLLAVVADPLKTIYATAIYGCLRRGELWALRRGAVDLDAGRITVRSSNRRKKTKSNKVRVVPIHVELRPYLQRQLDAHKLDLVFPSPRTGKMRSGDAKTSRTLKTGLRAAGIDRDLTFHDLRHTGATLLLRAGVSIAHVSKILGHASIQITVDTYGHLVVDDLADAMALLSVQIPTTPALGVVGTTEKHAGGAR